jgi:ATP-dependent helicase/nuclease subunit A
LAKGRTLDALPELKGEQAAASQPGKQVRLSASAGTGKTQVLTARVLRLLLQGVDPESILCLTFTKAGAAEMANRIHERLGAWVTMPGGDLGKDLKNLGEDFGPTRQEEARNLFARVLDARGSGLRIQTIHSFCQTLLASFPVESGLPGGFRPVEGREEEQLAASALATLVEGYDREGRSAALGRLKSTAKRLGESATRTFLRRCAAEPDAMAALPMGEGLGPFVRRALTDGMDDIQHTLALACDDAGFDHEGLVRLRAILTNWLTKSGTPRADGVKGAELISLWLALLPEDRPEGLESLRQAWLTASGEWRKAEPDDPEYRPLAERLDSWSEKLSELHRAAKVSAAITDALHIGRDYAQAYAEAKRSVAVVDFNDLIRSTVWLLATPGIGEWIKFKLDQSVDHILVDEAQDTNAAQWDIVKAVAGEFFAGSGAKGEGIRTLFTVGDFKQAIFGFQGTDPREFTRAGDHFAALAAGVDQEMVPLSLQRSFRSSQPILDATDAVLNELGFESLGLPVRPERHVSAKLGSGSVTLLVPVTNFADDDSDDNEEESDTLGVAEFEWAKSLAQKVRDWTTGGLRLRNQDRDAEPGDVMILVRSRGELARLIVSQLYQAGVEVAGVDRLRLNAPIAVQDMLACIRFVLQPQDDLSLACILVSPLIGWSQDELYDRAKGRQTSLWAHMGEEKPVALKVMLNRADISTPYQFLESILSDPLIQGRRRMIERLGEEARDPLEELLSAAIAFEAQATPSLQSFLDWFDRGNVDIKRDPAKAENAVRVMTVHGAKGLQAPVVVLADATSDPDNKRKTDLVWDVDGTAIPLFRPKKGELAGSLKTSAEAQDKKEADEHWRLLYVAMTRAEEHLFIGGALKPKQQGKELSERCWHGRVERALMTLPAERNEEGVLQLELLEKPGKPKPSEQAGERWSAAIPDWAARSAVAESRPPRPLAPSQIEAADDVADPPPSNAMRKAALRGTRLHSLFERLPAIPTDQRAEAADKWLRESAGEEDAAARVEMVQAALSVIEAPQFSAIFSPEALAEAPLAGVVGERVVAGTVDRLLISDSEILVVDFKTGSRVPKSVDAVSRHHKAQMGAYAAVLANIFPGRTVRAALLYSSGPVLIDLPTDILAAYKPGFSD